LTNVGVYLKEVRIVPDIEEKIIHTINELRNEYTYVLTTGGIGPTHDDITADCVAKAFDVGISENDDAIKMLLERIPLADLNASRRRMARIPHGAKLIENSVSKAPGFQISNVFVMAGVPSVMQAMLEVVIDRMETGQKLYSCNILTNIKEGDIADTLRAIQSRTSTVSIGSYPYYNDSGYGAKIVCRGKNIDELKSIASIIENELSGIGNIEIGKIT
jgi:molybdopterin-biosynthesis enzyme MoeA-like protein